METTRERRDEKKKRWNWRAFQGIFNRNYGKSRVDTGAKTEIKRTSRSINTRVIYNGAKLKLNIS